MVTRKLLRGAGDNLPNGGQGYLPADIVNLYNFPPGLTGQGQTIGILEFSDGYSLNDARAFWQAAGIAQPQLTFVSVDGTRNDGGTNPGDEEASLDLQWAGALAPGAHLIVYEASAGQTYATFADAVTRTLQYILSDTTYQPTVLSISYGDAEATFPVEAVTQWADLIAELDAKGVTVCVASGDQGAYGMHDLNGPLVRHADAPATCVQAVAVGGTSLQADGTETAWTYYGPQNGGATGGGFSTLFTQPQYQSGLGAQSGRGVPDVSFNADPATGYQIFFQGQPVVVGGTSVACPVFAAIVALANESRAQAGLPALSGLVQTLYGQAAAIPYNAITTGNNSFNGVTGFDAGPGWSACTGWGSVNVSQFVNWLSSVTGLSDSGTGV